MEIVIKRFKKEYQKEVRELILSGLKEHWRAIKYDLNPDLNDIASTYKKDIFLTAWYDHKIIGCGAAKIQEDKAEIVRMSVSQNFRRRGVGNKILDSLITELNSRSINEIILETTETWDEVITFYINYGFRVTHKKDGDIYFKLKE